VVGDRTRYPPSRQLPLAAEHVRRLRCLHCAMDSKIRSAPLGGGVCIPGLAVIVNDPTVEPPALLAITCAATRNNVAQRVGSTRSHRDYVVDDLERTCPAVRTAVAPSRYEVFSCYPATG